MSQPSLQWSAPEARHALYRPSLPCRALAAVMLQASRRLARAARWLALAGRRGPPPAGEPQLEFYAEAGAPEGALYADGKLVGYVAGVSRL